MKNLKTLENYVLLAIVFLTPLFFLPVFSNTFKISKIVFLVTGIILVLFIKIIRSFLEGNLKISSGNFDFPVFLLGISFLLSGILVTPNKMEAFFVPGNAILFVALALLYFLLNQSQLSIKTIKSTLFYSALLYSLVSILSISRIFEKIPQLPDYIKASTFNTEGALLPFLMFLTSILPFAIFSSLKEKDFAKKIFSAVTSIFIASAIILNLVNLKTDKNIKVIIPDFNSSWVIAVDSLKQNPLLGIGAGNYPTAFNLYRPITFNESINWNIEFTSARNIYLTILTEAGLMGLAGVIILVVVVFNIIKKNLLKDLDTSISLIVTIILLALFPSSISLTLLLFVLLSLISNKKDFEVNLTLKNQEGQKGSYFLTRIPAILILLPTTLGLIIFSINGIKTVKAEAQFKKAINSLSLNDAKGTYDYLQQATKLNPLVDRYRLSFSQVSFVIANSLAKNENLTDKDTETIAQLIQQAITEGKASVTLNINRSENWTNLASIYQAIIPFAQGADQFAIETYSQAVYLDPINPTTRISLGGIYYALGRYDEAIEAFKLAVIAKPDYANTHYNLAIALREKGNIEEAITQMELVLSLVEKGTTDYDLAKETLEKLEQKKVDTGKESSETLTPPQDLEETTITPPIELPEEATPPSNE